jgi:hypothetical protein
MRFLVALLVFVSRAEPLLAQEELDQRLTDMERKLTRVEQEASSAQRAANLAAREANQAQRVAGNAASYGAVAFLFGVFCALWAQNTGRNAWLWFFLGLIFIGLAAIVLLYKNSVDRSEARTA